MVPGEGMQKIRYQTVVTMLSYGSTDKALRSGKHWYLALLRRWLGRVRLPSSAPRFLQLQDYSNSIAREAD